MSDPREERILEEKDIQTGDVVSTKYRGGVCCSVSRAAFNNTLSMETK
jgi:hypothetical protein